MIIIKAISLFLVIILGLLAYFVGFMLWHAKKTKWDGFFALPLKERKAFEQSLKKHAAILVPSISIFSRFYRLKRLPTMFYKGVASPSVISSQEIWEKTEQYQPTEQDIFIATQMKCGTTWMQQIIFEILHHGEGDLSDNGYRHMYALSPWIETHASVPFERAPLVSRYNKRLVKTHLPASICPINDKAKYVYVTRHPVNCFASCRDFFDFLAGPFLPTMDNLVSWFCSDKMWWCSWPEHVKGWWQASQEFKSVKFITFEALKDDPRAVVIELSEFLGVTLSEDELERVLEKISFKYMSDNEALFEMAAPNLFSVSNDSISFMHSGKKNRDEKIQPRHREQIIRYCREELKGSDFPVSEYYPDLT